MNSVFSYLDVIVTFYLFSRLHTDLYNNSYNLTEISNRSAKSLPIYSNLVMFIKCNAFENMKYNRAITS
jgi:hypothetical protein